MNPIPAILAAFLLTFSLPSARAANPPVASPAPLVRAPDIVRVRSADNPIKDLIRQAMAFTDAGQLAEATKALDQAAELNQARGKRGIAIDQLIRQMKARIDMQAGRFDEAETLLKQLIVDAEATTRRGQELSSLPYSSLGELYMRQGRFAEAEPLLQRATELTERYAGKNDPATGETLNSLAVFYLKTGQVAKAQPLLERTLAIFRRLRATPENEASIADVLVNLGGAYQATGDYDKALDYFHQAFDLDMKLHGPDHPNTNLVLGNAGVLLGVMGRFDEAAPMMEAVLKATEARYGPDNVQTAHALNNIGWIELSRGNYQKALDYFRPALKVYLDHRALQKQGPNARGAAVDEREVGRTILGFLRAASKLAPTDPALRAALLDEAFQLAQQVHRGKAAEALSLTTARFAVGDGALATLIREQQDLSDRSQLLEQALTAALSMSDRQRDRAREAAGREQLQAMQARIAAIGAEIAKAFPDYVALADPKPLTIAEAEALLGPDEAMVLVAPFGGSNGEGAFTFVVTKEGASWRSGTVGQTQLTEMVEGLRCGLDIGQWDTQESRNRCGQRIGVSTLVGDELPFDAGLANGLFTAIFGDLAPMLGDKTLLVVAPDPLASLPFQVLLKAPPASKDADYASLAWLGRTNPIAALPAAAALRGERTRKSIEAPQPFIGFGDPTLSGGLDCGGGAVPSACPVLARPAASTSPLLASRGRAGVEIAMRGVDGQADLDAVRSLCPLPETALELNCVAASVKSPPASVRIGAEATVPAVLAEPLDRYRIVHFATHGLLAGDMENDDGGQSEPALVLTPPASPTPGDDGLLRASEIATLKLNADWVVLSACNTAAGAKLGGEAMSGLASAFFYAGARALLVSHWPVRSDAAVLLTTAAFAEMTADPSIGRAKAMRDAMVALIDEPSGAYSHPSVWAPFAVVGESGPANW